MKGNQGKNGIYKKQTDRKKIMQIQMLKAAELVGHRLNRQFPVSGAEWDDFLVSVREAGEILVPLHVWISAEARNAPVILAGHRRTKAAVACGIVEVPCIVHDMTAEEALAFLVNENLQRLELNPVDEARLVAAMRDEMGMAEVEIAERISRSVEWVRTRQLLLDLGDEVVERVALPRNDDRHVTMGAVQAILEVPEDLRERAVQMVLYPALEEFALKERQARDVLRCHLIEPRIEEEAWNKGLPKVVEVWRKRLKKELGKDAGEGLMVRGIPWADLAKERRGTADAEGLVPEVEKSGKAPAKLRWVDLALRHGLAVKVVRGQGLGAGGKSEEESAAVVDVEILRMAEASYMEHGEEAWLIPAGKGGVNVERRTSDAEHRSEEDRVKGALSVLDGEGETVWQEDEKTEGVPEGGGMEHHAWCDLTGVARLGKWALAGETNPEVDETSAPEGAPRWVKEMAAGKRWHWITDVCEWVLEMRVKR